MDYQNILNEIENEIREFNDEGNVASYIPELSLVDPNKFGAYLITTDNHSSYLGDSDEKFSIQSIAKVISLTLAFNLEDDGLWERVGVEPSGTPFNSLIQLEYERGIPRNPLINAGALVICDILITRLKNPKSILLDFVRKLSGNSGVDYSSKVSASERKIGYKNAALVNLMKSFGNIQNNIEVVLDFYFTLCSIEMTCKELAQTFLFLASNGVNTLIDERVMTISKAKRINAIMQLCGFYDEAGEFSFKVGLPGKSGVGGGIVAIRPGKYSVAVWSPKLNKKGNSVKGMKVLELLTTKTQSSIF